MKIRSTAFGNGDPIPTQYTRYGADKSPPLQIEEIPAQTRSLALIMDDPDATRGLFTHWVLFDIDPKTQDIPEGNAPKTARHGANDWGEAKYGGPKPPSGDHRYFFHVFALDSKLELHDGSTRGEVERAMQNHLIDHAQLMGRFAASQAQKAG